MKIILFDGVCNLCNYAVQWIIKRDYSEVYRFASLQSRIGQNLRAQFQISETNSLVFIDESNVYIKSSAIIRLCRYLPNYQWVRLGFMIPTPIRDALYEWVAAHRYRWFGMKETCTLPSDYLKHRFLDE